MYAQVQDMLNKAFDKYKDLKGFILCSDQWWQYQMRQYHSFLESNLSN